MRIFFSCQSVLTQTLCSWNRSLPVLFFYPEPTPGADQRRLFPEEEIQETVSIVCKQVPKQALVSKKILEKHFSAFGRVTKVVVSSAKEMAIVHFESHDSAKNAKENGLAITPKLIIGAIFFGKSGEGENFPESSYRD